MFVIVLNQNNIVQDGQNNKLVYKFPNSVNLTDKYIAVSSISMYYSWFNILSTSVNNTLSYTWTVGGVTTTYTLVIPDGLYEIADINSFIQWSCIQNGTYLINNSGSNVYYIELLVNASRYAIQLNTFQVPTSLPTGWTAPSNFAGFPTQTFNPIVTFPANFNKIVGYPSNFASNNNVNNAYTPPTPTSSNNYVAKDGAGTLSYLSNTSPQVQPNNNVLFSVSNINNPYAQPSSIIYSLNPNVNIGEQIYVTPPNFMWNKLIDGTYNEIRLTFLGTNLQPLIINDPNMTILLTIRDKSESFLGTK
jgi:hypothetical protein